MEYLVIGGTGTVGSQVVRDLTAAGHTVGVLSRSAGKADLPAGARPVPGDLRKPESLAPAFRGVQRVFLLNALSQDETEQGLAAVKAAREAGVERLVYLSVVMPPGTGHIPHFASKVPIEEAVRSSGAAWTILRPNSFFQNDLWFRGVLTAHGVYPEPLGSRGVWRVDVRDISDAAVNALTRAGGGAGIVPVNGPEALTGADVAATWSRHLGREVRYGGDDLDAWEAQARSAMPEWLVHDLRIMYAYFQERGIGPAPGDHEIQERAVGHPPRRFEDWVRETAAGWKA